MNLKHVIALLVTLVIPICMVHSQGHNQTLNKQSVHGKPNNQSMVLYRSRRCFTDKYYELKKHEFDSLISLLKFKFTQLLLFAVWVKQIWLRILSVPLAKVGVNFTQADLQGPFQHLMGIKHEPSANTLKPAVKNNIQGIHGPRVEEMEEEPIIVRTKRSHRLNTIPALAMQAAQETIFAPFIWVYKISKATFSFMFRRVQFVYHFSAYDSCRYKTVCQVTEYIWDRIPLRLSEYLLAYVGQENFEKLLQSENEYLNAFVVGILDLDCDSSYNHFC